MKRLIISFIGTTFMILCLLAAYTIYLPVEYHADSIQSAEYLPSFSSAEEAINYTIHQEAKDGLNYFLFYKQNHPDSMYLINDVLSPLAESLNLKSFDNIKLIDISDLDDDFSPVRLKNNWGFENYPALVVYKLENGVGQFTNALQWTASDPLDQVDLKNWMQDVGQWVGPTEELKEKIEEPKQ